MDKDIEYTKSFGNVFQDLAFPNAEEMLIKAGLVGKIDKLLKKKKLTQSGAAKILGTSQSRLSAILKGQFDSVSLERLCKMLTALDQDIEITIKPKARSHHAGEIRVCYA